MKHKGAARAPKLIQDAERLRGLITGLCLEAMDCVPRPKVEETVRQWLARTNFDPDDPDAANAIGQALMLASELTTFAPSLSGSTAVDRLLRQGKSMSGEERAALEALKEADFRLLRIRAYEPDGLT
jgi:hypothetical protein